jgi:hypothetical protein
MSVILSGKTFLVHSGSSSFLRFWKYQITFYLTKFKKLWKPLLTLNINNKWLLYQLELDSYMCILFLGTTYLNVQSIKDVLQFDRVSNLLACMLWYIIIPLFVLCIYMTNLRWLHGFVILLVVTWAWFLHWQQLQYLNIFFITVVLWCDTIVLL